MKKSDIRKMDDMLEAKWEYEATLMDIAKAENRNEDMIRHHERCCTITDMRVLLGRLIDGGTESFDELARMYLAGADAQRKRIR